MSDPFDALRDRLARFIPTDSDEPYIPPVNDQFTEAIQNDLANGFHDKLTEKLEYRNPPNLRIYDGPPRFAHKTTRCVREAANTTNRKIIICQNHQLAEETVRDKLGSGRYSVNATSVVHLQGKSRSCPNCTHELDGSNYFKYQNAVEQVLREYNFISPKNFEGIEDICPYHAHKMAAEQADWIVTVGQMADRLNEIPGDIIIDEEDAMGTFFPNVAPFMKFGPSPAPYRNFDIREMHWSEDGIDYVRDRVQDKINDLDRVNSRYNNTLNAINAFERITELIPEYYEEIEQAEDYDEVCHIIENIELPSVELEGRPSEHSATYDYIQKNFSRSQIAPKLEALFHNPKFKTTINQEGIHVNIVPDPLSGFLKHKEMFAQAENIWLVGNLTAKYFSAHFHPDPEGSYKVLNYQAEDMLDIIQIHAEDENSRRSFMTNIAQKLTANGKHNLLIAGSSNRAYQASDRIGASSYFFKGNANLQHYQDHADLNYNVTTYMGSRGTRGVDLDTQITIVRSTQFAAPRWAYYRNSGEAELDATGAKMANYENMIETHNAMLRGAGQGEKHVSIIPHIPLYWGLEKFVTRLGLELEKVLDLIQTMLEFDNHTCQYCHVRFVTEDAYMAHECEDQAGH